MNNRKVKNTSVYIAASKSFISVAVAIIFLLAITIMAFVNNREKNMAEVKTIKIGVSIYDEYDTHLASMIEGINKWAKEKEQETGSTILLDVVMAGSSQLIQNDQVENFANKGYNVICVNLVDRTDVSVIIDKAKSVNMPIVFFNRELVSEDLERWDKLFYVGADAKQSGTIQGDIVADYCDKYFKRVDRNADGILQYVVLEGEAGHQDALVRTESSVNQLVSAGFKLEKLGDEIANWNKAQATTKMTQFVEKYGDEIEIVFANNDDMALGALEVYTNDDEVRKAGRLPAIVGVDGNEEALNKIHKHQIIGTVYNNSDEQTRIIIEMAYVLARNEEFPEDIQSALINKKSIYVPYEKITFDNVQDYMKE